jgi:ATP phosphoribosyltransferase
VSLTVALSKGKLLAGSAALFTRAGLPFPEDEGRRLVVEMNGLRFLFVKDMDVPTYVEYGVADCGVAGRDVLLETGGDVLEPLDLGFGRCRLVVARRREDAALHGRQSTVRVATKYPRVAARHFQERGFSVEVVKLSGSVEIAPGLGLADCIVDVVETGGTLAANGLVPVEEVASSSARFIVNRAGYHARRDEVARLLQSLRKAAA